MERSRTKLSDGALIAQANAHYRQGLVSTAELLADLAEIETRRIHIAMGYPSMRAWCIAQLKMTDAAILDRIQAARTAREYPAIFSMLADGRLNLTTVLMLSPYLTIGNAAELLAGTAGKTKSELAEWLAGRFPTSESLPMMTTFDPASSAIESPKAPSTAAINGTCANSVVPERANWHMCQLPGKVTPVAAGRHRFEFMGSDAERGLVRQVQDLHGSNDLAEIFFEGLALLLKKLETRRCAKTTRPQRAPRARRPGGRLVPAAVRREVWKRDGHRCAFVGENGRRCEARRGLECDHIVPVARGGESSVANVRLLCRAHNQFEAERVFGRDFMEGKRERARVKSETQAQAETQVLAQAAAHERFLDVIAALSGLGLPIERARWAAESAREPGATLEQHIRAALKLLRPGRTVTTTASPAAPAASAA